MKTTKNWRGADASNTTSLFEYGYLCRQTKQGLQVIYKNGNNFSFGWFDPFYFWNESWVKINDICEFSGLEVSDYANNNELFMADLLSFYGSENIFGCDYSGGYSEAEIRKYLNKALNK